MTFQEAGSFLEGRQLSNPPFRGKKKRSPKYRRSAALDSRLKIGYNQGISLGRLGVPAFKSKKKFAPTNFFA